jgi:hypothetical protein
MVREFLSMLKSYGVVTETLVLAARFRQGPGRSLNIATNHINQGCLVNITTSKQHSESNGIKVLLHGFTGVGKTRAVSHLFQAGYKPLFVSAEGGTKSIAEFDIPLVDISVDNSGNPIPMEKRFSRLGEVFKFLKDGKHDFDTAYVDSLTEINKCLIAELAAKPEFQDPKNTLRLYSENKKIMANLARAFRDLPMNIVLVALSTADKDDVGRRFITADLVGSVSGDLPPLMDEVLYLHTLEKEGKQVTQFQTFKTAQVDAKDRAGKLLPFEQYDLGSIFNKLSAVRLNKKEN